jgi:membrane protease YdiL (CAAX protease family)
MRRRVDLSRLSAPARYAVALAVLAAVVGIVLLVRAGGGGADEPAAWYTVLVKVGAVALLVYLAGRLVWWARTRVRRQPPGGR